MHNKIELERELDARLTVDMIKISNVDAEKIEKI